MGRYDQVKLAKSTGLPRRHISDMENVRRPTGDPFYSARNQEALLRSAGQVEAGQVVTKTLDELDAMEI